MRLQNKNDLAYLVSISLLFSYVELLLPKVLPFFKLGLSNVSLLIALESPFSLFFMLTLLKSITSSFMQGTLFSPFFLLSISQSFFSGLFMYFMHRLRIAGKKLFSIWSISAAASVLSAFIQISLSYFYLDKGVFIFLGPMMLFNFISGLFTAFISLSLNFPEKAPLLQFENSFKEQRKRANFFKIIVPLLLLPLIFIAKNVYFLTACLFLSILYQLLQKRRFLILPHLFMWIFIFITALFIPSGKVLYKIASFSITSGALLQAFVRAVRLSSFMALSQGLSTLKFTRENTFTLSIKYFASLLDLFKKSEGKIIERVKKTLTASEL